MRTPNYIDVTKEYWETRNVVCHLSTSYNNSNVVYACVFNFLNWHPAWWGLQNKDSVVFTDMCRGAVFLPMYYNKGKLIPAGYPVASGYNNVLVLKPDIINTHTIHLTEQEHYLVFRSEKKYKLYYWDKAWKFLGEKTGDANVKEMVFDNIPRNALLLLVPEYSQHKERPFSITDEGKRLWW